MCEKKEREREREKVECVEREKKGERTPNFLIIANNKNCITHNLSPSNITHTMYAQNTHTHTQTLTHTHTHTHTFDNAEISLL